MPITHTIWQGKSLPSLFLHKPQLGRAKHSHPNTEKHVPRSMTQHNELKQGWAWLCVLRHSTSILRLALTVYHCRTLRAYGLLGMLGLLCLGLRIARARFRLFDLLCSHPIKQGKPSNLRQRQRPAHCDKVTRCTFKACNWENLPWPKRS